MKIRNIYLLIFILFVVQLSSCSKHKGSPEKPIELPTKELTNIMDATGCPTKTSETPAIFIVNLNNQTDWFLTSIEICLKNKTSGISRIYLGNPFAFVIEKSQYDKVSAIAPKNSGHFLFNIGTLLSWKEKLKDGSKYMTEYVFEPYEWSIVKANGYKR